MHFILSLHSGQIVYFHAFVGNLYGKNIWGPNVKEFHRRFDPEFTKDQGIFPFNYHFPNVPSQWIGKFLCDLLSVTYFISPNSLLPITAFYCSLLHLMTCDDLVFNQKLLEDSTLVNIISPIQNRGLARHLRTQKSF